MQTVTLPRPSRHVARRAHVLRLVDEAIAMVAAGYADRVVVAGIQLGAAHRATVERRAVAAGVRARDLARADGIGVDVAIEVAPE